LSVGLAALFLFAGCYNDDEEVFNLSRARWLHRWGQSPVDTMGMPEWAKPAIDSADWKPIRELSELRLVEDSNYMWLRTKLPQTGWRQGALFFPPIISACEIYLDGQKVYTFGNLEVPEENRFSQTKYHFVSLPIDAEPASLTLKLFSADGQHIGVRDVVHKVLYGEREAVLKQIFKANFDSVLFGFFFIFCGLISAFIFCRRFSQRQYPLISFSLFASTVGIFLVAGDVISQPFFPSPAIRASATIATFLFFPVGLFSFYEQIIGAGPKKIIRRVWQWHLVYAVIAFTLIMTGHLASVHALSLLFVFLIFAILITITTGARHSRKADFEIRLFHIGFTILALSGFHDIMVEWGVLPDWHWLFQWGTFIFILILGYLLEREFTGNHRQLELYSEDLETKSRELEQSNLNLERRVKERTQELDEKNRSLENTLEALKDAQDQLIIKEKMASLGNLVAGIAHEVNTPIGAVNSAADVSTRCIDKICNIFENARSLDSIQEDATLAKSLKLLRDNNNVALTASKRIVQIVRSLKNFARLDQAEFQDVDVHEGIDSTLTLIHHEIKNRIEIIKEYGTLPLVSCYPNQLNQVFMNLLVNASQAIDGKGTIKIKTEALDENVRISITDDGRGILEKDLKRIFDPGFTTKGVGVGTGLGLAISYNIIEKHAGKIEASSEKNSGTTFVITLPVKQKGKST
jgi:signal transduction histidine kinase